MKAFVITSISVLSFLLLIWFSLFYEGTFALLPGSCSVLRFPGELTFSSRDLTSRLATRIDPLEFRRTIADPTKIMVTVQSQIDLESSLVTYAEQKYSFDLYRPASLNRISEERWASGRTINPLELDTLPANLFATDPEGRVVGFNQSGKNGRFHPVLSLDRKQVALASYTGFYSTMLMSQQPDHGLWYWDAVIMTSHKKCFKFSGLFMGLVVGDAQGSASWLPDSRLVLNPSSRKREFILCDLSGSTP